MITGWGSHHLDTAQWGLGMEDSGPVEISGKGDFAKSGLWDVHGDFHIEYVYANGVRMLCTDEKARQHGIRFEGSDGWVHVRPEGGEIQRRRRSQPYAVAGDARSMEVVVVQL